MASLNAQHAWKKTSVLASNFVRDRTPFYLTPTNMAAAVDRLGNLGAPATYAATKVIPANTLAVGDVITLRGSVNFVALNGADTQSTALLQTATVIASSAALLLTATNKVALNAVGVVTGSGPSGEICWLGNSAASSTAPAYTSSGAAAIIATDTTSALTFYVAATHSAASAGNQSDLRQLDLQVSRTVGNGIDPAVVLGNVNALGLPGWKMNTAGERVRSLYQIADVNTSAEVFARVLWTSGSATAADTIAWKVSVKVQTPGSALTVSSPTTVSLSDTATASAYDYQITPAVAFAAGVIDNMDLFSLEVEMDAKAAGLTEDIFFLGVEFLYVPIVVADEGIALPSLPSGWPGT